MKKYNVEELREKLDRCRNVSLSEISLDDVDELSSIKINKKMKPEQRILDFITKAKNPYVFKVNGRLVKLDFSDNGKNAENAITNVIKSIYR